MTQPYRTNAVFRGPAYRHYKIHGFIEELGSPWRARLAFPGDHGYDTYADMTEPLPDHAVQGSFFTIHQPKRGMPYFYWPKRYITRGQWKKARISARRFLTRAVDGA